MEATLIPNPDYKLPAKKGNATPEEAAAYSALVAAWEAVKANGPVERLPYATATENIRNSGGMYAFLPAKTEAPAATAVLMPEEMSEAALKLTALQLGIDMSKKGMKKSELVKAVRLAMDAVQFAAEDEEDDAEA